MRPLVRRVIPVAGLVSVVVAVVFVAVSLALDVFVSSRLTADLDQRIAERLESARQPAALFPLGPIQDEEDRSFEAPLIVWRLNTSGQVVQSSSNSPPYPTGLSVSGPTTARIAGTDFRLAVATVPDGRVVVGESLASVESTTSTLLFAELLVGPVLIVLVFFGTIAVSWRVASPIERVRQQQLAFTADASHELRTPLSVIEAETSLALRRESDAPAYRGALERIGDEATRLRRIVEDLLLLARADALPPPPTTEVTELVAAARSATERFKAVAVARNVDLSTDLLDKAAPVAVPAEWVDRLLGILLDNACRYTPEGGRVIVSVDSHRNRSRIGVDDSGPGIPPEERRRIFNRFHRATATASGAGLGLAIADAIVQASRGRWELERAPIGGARIAVSWARAAVASDGP